MQKTISENKAIITFAYNFQKNVSAGNWVTRYDTDTDSFSFSVKNLPDDARLKYFGDEFAFYVTKKGEVKGIFIEYFNKNFVAHNKEASAFKDMFTKMELKQKDGESLLEVKSSKLQAKMIKGLEEALEDSLAKGMNLQPAR